MDYYDYKIREDNLNKYITLIKESKSRVSIPVMASINCYFHYSVENQLLSHWAVIPPFHYSSGGEIPKLILVAEKVSPPYYRAIVYAKSLKIELPEQRTPPEEYFLHSPLFWPTLHPLRKRLYSFPEAT